MRRLGCLRGIGTLTGFALAGEIGDWHRFTGRRHRRIRQAHPGRALLRRLPRPGADHQDRQRARAPALVEAAWHHRARYHVGTTPAGALAARGGVVSVAIAGAHLDRLRFVNDLRVITSAVSLGHDETLVAYEHYPEARAAGFAPAFREHGLIRLAVGLESAEDLLADLDAALTTAYGPNR